MKDVDIKKNIESFVKYVESLEKFGTVGIVTWGNYETSRYNNLKKKYNLCELKIIDLCGLLKKNNIFDKSLSLSLKKIIPMLNDKYPESFPNIYKDLVILDGNFANLEIYDYYKTCDESIKDDIEKYNKIDCLVMLDIVNWLKSEME